MPVLRMARPMRRKGSSNIQFRRRIPSDVLEKARGMALMIPVGDIVARVTVTPTAEQVQVSLRTSDKTEAEVRHAQVAAHLERVWASLRGGNGSLADAPPPAPAFVEAECVSLKKTPEGLKARFDTYLLRWIGLHAGTDHLSHKQVHALAGKLYRLFVTAYDEEPGSGEAWRNGPARYEMGEDGVPNRLPLLPAQPETVPPSPAWRFGPLIDAVLAKEALALDADSSARLLTAAQTALEQASNRLFRAAQGDYAPDPQEDRFPKWEPPAASPGRKQGGGKRSEAISSLLEDWWSERKATGTRLSTFENYRHTFEKFIAFLGHDDASRLTPEDVVGFKDHRFQEVNPKTGKPISPRTVKESDLCALKSVFGWAVSNRRLSTNPAAGITIKLGKPIKVRPKGFIDAEASAILSASARAERGREDPKTYAAKRWVPWLCAYTGARLGEMVQLRKEDIRQEDGMWVLKITPEAGSVKTNEARDVVIHPHLIDVGFADFIAAASPGYLFLNVEAGSDMRGPWRSIKNRVTEFVRKVVPDPNVQPSHGWRHRFKTVGREAGVSDRVLDAICGHAPANVGDSYGEVNLRTQADAMTKIPRLKVD